MSDGGHTTSASPEPIWLREDVVRAIHRRLLAAHGGHEGVRSTTALGAAVARARHLHTYADPPPDLPELAASYAFALIRNAPFLDGNHRMALVACRTFLLINGYEVAATPAQKYRALTALVSARDGEATFAAWLREYMQPVRGGNGAVDSFA